MTPACIICRSHETRVFLEISELCYFRCEECKATFLNPAQALSREEERAHYLHHENQIDDPGYRAFLSKLSEPLQSRLPSGAVGLDYGCGPGPALAAMLEEAGHSVSLYDPFFYSDPKVLDRQYDFITCTETVEHFHAPANEFDQLDAMLRPGGWLGVMTCFQTDDDKFAAWHYRADPTHVVFYKEQTFRWLAAHYGWTLTIPCKDVALMQKPE